MANYLEIDIDGNQVKSAVVGKLRGLGKFKSADTAKLRAHLIGAAELSIAE